VIVFGSYLDPKRERLGDLDVAIKLRRCSDDEEVQKTVEESRRNGRRFANVLEWAFWPQSEVYRFLKARSRVLSVQDARSLPEGLDPAPRVVYRMGLS
jgi:predicted nucleotidyltransferase